MIGCQDFCGHYDWTFAYLQREYGEEALRDYWEQAIARDSQAHARALIAAKGFQGMAEYWGHTLAEEEAGYVATAGANYYRVDMHRCPSLGFLLERGQQQFADYCEHCIGWIGPLMADYGFAIDHAHNHRGQCWWEFRRASEAGAPSAPGEVAGPKDVRLRQDWESGPIDRYLRSRRE
ncbi:MAG: hypothetical protein GX774_09515 [Armatimonadetes bacterium]|nr:hypothetical protein [Armatimonadota bacterium]